MYIKNLFIENMGPIEKFHLGSKMLFKVDGKPKPLVLIGKNGTGKTTLLSGIVDAIFELANNSFDDILPRNGTGYSFFKVSGGTNIKIGMPYAFTFIQFTGNGKDYQYIDKNGKLEFNICKQKTNNLLVLDSGWEDEKNLKKITNTRNDTNFQRDFENNSYCFFPSDRFELPYWINRSTLSGNEQFVDYPHFSGQLNKNILVRRSLLEIKNWILDVFLDSRADIVFNEGGNANTATPLKTIRLLQKSIKNIETILSLIVQKDITINLNYRGQGVSRIKIVDKKTNKDYIPSLDHLSAGQSTLLGIFSTIIKYSDTADINKSIQLENIEGIVLIDEADLHLHISLQYEVFPELMKLFPKVQFILTSQSPFLLSGMAKKFSSDEILFINMPNGTILNHSDDFEEFSRAYCIFEELTNTYKEELHILRDKIEASSKPLIITEGKTDWRHLKASLSHFSDSYPELDIEFLEYEDELDMGDSALRTMIEGLKPIPQNRKIIFIFDRDNQHIVKELGVHEFNNHGNNVYSFCIPRVSEILDEISIEYYYDEIARTTLDKNGRRLFDGREFLPKSGNSLCGNYQLKEKNKAGRIVIVDKGVFRIADLGWENSIALSKNEFSMNILNKEEGFDLLNFENFKLILDIIQSIVKCD